jgi:type VI secretion system protein ImpA
VAIDIDAYLKDIDSDNVCGKDLQYDPKFIELEQAIKGKPEQQMGGTVTEAEPPNWRDIRKQCEALLSRTIDLRVLVYYLRALVALEGVSGLQDGLTLIRTLVENRWDTLHPQLDPDDDNDPTERINTLVSLCDHDIMLWPLQQTPLLESKSLGRFNFRQVSIASGKSTATSNEKEVNQATIDGAIQECEIAYLQKTLQAITVSLDNLDQLENAVTDYVGITEAPSFAELRNFLKECKVFLITALETKGVSGDTADQELITDENISAANAVTTASEKSISGAINNNQDVIKTLNMVCDYYKKHEPSSPVPMFIERAIKLVGKNFMDALKDVAPAGIDEARFILGKQNEEDK